MTAKSDDTTAPGGPRGLWNRLGPNHRGAVFMVGAAIGFTANSALVKALGETDFHPLQLAFLRTAVALAVMLPLAARAGPAVLRSRAPRLHVLRGSVGTAAVVAGFFALVQMPLADFIALTFTTPLFMILLAVLLLGERVRWRRWTATAIGFVGVLIMVRPGSAGFDWDALLALGMAAGIALASSTVKRFPEGEAPFAMLFWFTVLGTLLTAVPAALVWRAPNLEEWLLLMVMSSLGAAAQFLIIKAYKAGEATFVAPFDYAKLLIGGLLGYFVFAEIPDLWTLLGAAVIVASTVYIARREAQAAPPKDAAPVAPTG